MTDLPIEANACGLSLRDLDGAVEKEVCVSTQMHLQHITRMLRKSTILY